MVAKWYMRLTNIIEQMNSHKGCYGAFSYNPETNVYCIYFTYEGHDTNFEYPMDELLDVVESWWQKEPYKDLPLKGDKHD